MKTIDEVIKALEYCLNPVDNFGNCNAECPYIHCCDPSNHDVTEDALHYLKEYREMLNTRIYIPEGYTREKTGFTHQDFANTFREEPHFIRDFMVGTSQNSADTSQKITCPKCHSEFVILPESNPALTWDELRMMDGKPVWATFDNENGTWYIAKVYDDEVVLYEWGQEFGERISGAWDYTPKRWQAYRKERE